MGPTTLIYFRVNVIPPKGIRVICFIQYSRPIELLPHTIDFLPVYTTVLMTFLLVHQSPDYLISCLISICFTFELVDGRGIPLLSQLLHDSMIKLVL